MERVKVVSIVGMPGAGKTEVAHVFEEKGYIRIRFGDLTDREILRRGLDINEKNERLVRELLRQEYGMSVYAKLNLPAIDSALQQGDVVIDGLYSWEEYLFLKEKYDIDFQVVAVWSSPDTRHKRLNSRRERPLGKEEAVSRDKAEIEKVNKGGPIAMADFTLLNESSLRELRTATEEVIANIR
jgi:dephospho-CoA kinase